MVKTYLHIDSKNFVKKSGFECIINKTCIDKLSINSTIDLKRDDLFNLLETCHYLCTNQKIVINQDYVNIEFNVNAKQPFEIIFRFQVKPNNFFYLEEIIGLNYINDLIKCQNM